MIRFDEFLEKFSFKKFIKIYLLVSVVIMIGCVSVTLYMARDKIKMAISYRKVTTDFRKNGITDRLKSELKTLSSDSKDVKNLIISDVNNKVLYQENNNLLSRSKEFILSPYSYYNNYLQDNTHKNIIYKIDRDRDIILNKNYVKEHNKIQEDIDNSFAYELDTGSKSVYLLNYTINRQSGNMLYMIREVRPIPRLEDMLEIIAMFGLIIFGIYWIGLALWVYRDANRKRCNSSLWGLLVLITNFAGLIIYILFKQNNVLCGKCGAIQSKDSRYCYLCGTKLSRTCEKCGIIIRADDHYCKSCGVKLFDNENINI